MKPVHITKLPQRVMLIHKQACMRVKWEAQTQAQAQAETQA